jgi:hypothetical protein
MKKKFSGRDAGARSYYDPSAKPYPAKPIVTAAPNLGPVQNTRQARRARARLPFIEQRALALKVGFAVPAELQLTRETGAEFWITTWEELYTRLVFPKPAPEDAMQVVYEDVMRKEAKRGAQGQ